MAGRLILATVGTSALDRKKLDLLRLGDQYQGIGIELSYAQPQQFHGWVQGQGVPGKVTSFVEAYSEALTRPEISEEIQKPPKGTNIFSGEMSSLYLMYQNPDADPDLEDLEPEADTLVLLLSDSAEGVLCGLLHYQLLSEGQFLREQNIIPKLQVVNGLQVENLPQFLQTGLKEFSAMLRTYTKGQLRKPVLNATGGFKSLVPYTTFFSVAYGIPLFFVFEELARLISIKPPHIKDETERKRFLSFLQEAMKPASVNLGIPPSDF